MWPSNALTERLHLKWPIFQAPMGIFTTPALAAAVTNAGGLGGLGMWGCTVEEAERRILGFRQQSGGSLNVNYVFWPEPEQDEAEVAAMRRRLRPHYDAAGLGAVPEPQGHASDVTPEHLEMLLEHKPEVISFHFGLPRSETLQAIKDAGVFVACTATTVEEARILERSGVDAIVAQGTEAGGHRGTFTGVDMSMQAGLLSLLPQVVDAVSVPVIAAGGIADGRTAAAAFVLGASAVQMGTAFLRCDETNIHPHHRAALAEADESSTIVTDLISGRPSRYVRNLLIDDLIGSGLKPLPIPTQFSIVAPLGQSGDRERTALFAGQSVALTKDRPAADLVTSLAEETAKRLRAFGNGSA